MSYTLIIPTHNRSSYLKRNLEYLTELDFAHKLIIADSSSDEYAIKNQNLVSEASSKLNISYFCLQGKDKYLEKMSLAFSMVTTPTLMISGDDDFIVPDQVENCAKFLIENDSYAIASGKIAEFKKAENGLLWKSYDQFELLDSNPIIRFCNYLPNYRPTVYSVHKTKSVQKNFEKSFTENIGRSLSERLFCIFDVLDGKVKVFNDLFMVREKGLTLTDESGNSTWVDDIGKSIAVTKTNLNFKRYEEILLEAVLKSNTDNQLLYKTEMVSQLIDEDFNNWMFKKNSTLYKSNILEKAIPRVLQLLRKLKAKLRSFIYLRNFTQVERNRIYKIERFVNK